MLVLFNSYAAFSSYPASALRLHDSTDLSHFQVFESHVQSDCGISAILRTIFRTWTVNFICRPFIMCYLKGGLQSDCGELSKEPCSPHLIPQVNMITH